MTAVDIVRERVQTLLRTNLDSDQGIVCSPVSKRPSLLLHRLPGAGQTGVALAKSLQSSLADNDCVAVYGTSGCGKTRTCFEYLSQNHGLYLVADTMGNGGSQDLQYIVQRTLPGLKSGDQRLNWENASSAFIYILVTRLMVFRRLLELHGNTITPHLWLLIQLYPIWFLGSDVFKEIALYLIDKKLAVDYQISASYNSLLSVVVIDEAQLLCEPCVYLRAEGTQSRPVLSPLACACGLVSPDLKVCVTGTGFTMTGLVRTILVSPVMKFNPVYIMHDFGTVACLDDVNRLLEWAGFLSLVREEVKMAVVAVLRGRYRFATTWIGTAIELGMDFAGALKALVDAQLTLGNEASNPSLATKVRSHLNKDSIVAGLVCKLAMDFFLAGKGVMYFSSEGSTSNGNPERTPQALVEHGICRLSGGSGAELSGAMVVLDEPLVAMAVHKCQSLMETILNSMSGTTESAMGFSFEPLVAFSLSRLLRTFTSYPAPFNRCFRLGCTSPSEYLTVAVRLPLVVWLERMDRGEATPVCCFPEEHRWNFAPIEMPF